MPLVGPYCHGLLAHDAPLVALQKENRHCRQVRASGPYVIKALMNIAGHVRNGLRQCGGMAADQSVRSESNRESNWSSDWANPVDGALWWRWQEQIAS